MVQGWAPVRPPDTLKEGKSVITVRNPADRPAPPTYHHGVEVTGAVRTLYVAGQIGMAPDGTVPEGIEAQSRLVYANLEAVLGTAGMSLADVVRTTVFLLRPEDRAKFAAVREEAMGGLKNASTMLFVAGLALPTLLVEVEAIAVKPTAD
jgi:2-iminobutanoate/2-iminopropanoate deaminase